MFSIVLGYCLQAIHVDLLIIKLPHVLTFIMMLILWPSYSLNYVPQPPSPPPPSPPSTPTPSLIVAQPPINPTAVIVTLVISIVVGVTLLVGAAYWLFR
jgi:hypothetical protein